MNRRDILIGAGAVSAASLVWRELLGAPSAIPSGSALSVALCDLVIPDSSTPGARQAGVPAFMALALQHRLAGASNEDMTALQAQLDQEGGGDFIKQTPARQHSILSVIDVRDAANPSTAWARVKKLILMGYYTSEIGASQELQYQLVPGRFDPDLPVKSGDRAWSSDWIGQGF